MARPSLCGSFGSYTGSITVLDQGGQSLTETFSAAVADNVRNVKLDTGELTESGNKIGVANGDKNTIKIKSGAVTTKGITLEVVDSKGKAVVDSGWPVTAKSSDEGVVGVTWAQDSEGGSTNGAVVHLLVSGVKPGTATITVSTINVDGSAGKPLTITVTVE
jgi:hypothetical protein